MGNRSSISFKQGSFESPVLCSHWGGEGLFEEAEEYVKELREEARKRGAVEPLYRLEPWTVFVDFIRHITRGKGRVTHDLYVARTEDEVDNSDCGHRTISLDPIN